MELLQSTVSEMMQIIYTMAVACKVAMVKMSFDGLREDKVPPPGSVPIWYVEDIARPAATGN